MLFFLISIVLKDGLEFYVFACIRALVVPIHGFQFFHQRNNRSMHVARFSGQLLYRFVITNAGHFFPLMIMLLLLGGAIHLIDRVLHIGIVVRLTTVPELTGAAASRAECLPSRIPLSDSGNDNGWPIQSDS